MNHSKYRVINGKWYKGECISCGVYITSHTAKRCRSCFKKSIKGVVRVSHNTPHSDETKKLISQVKSKDELTYSGLHVWLNREFGSANRCENLDCLGESKFFDWACVGKYLKDRSQYVQLCRKCHKNYDMGNLNIRLEVL